MSADEWTDPQAEAVARALRTAESSHPTTDRHLLRGEVLRLRAHVTALTAEHSGACDDMAQCTRCWEREQIEEASRLRREVARLEAELRTSRRSSNDIVVYFPLSGCPIEGDRAKHVHTQLEWRSCLTDAETWSRHDAAADEMARAAREVGLYDTTDETQED